jgi:hypothetical protein
MDRLVAILVLAVAAACGGGNGSDSVCVPGKVEACPCAGGGQGVQVCDDSGEKLGECTGCPGADAMPGDQSSGTDTVGQDTAVGPDGARPDEAGPDVGAADQPACPGCDQAGEDTLVKPDAGSPDGVGDDSGQKDAGGTGDGGPGKDGSCVPACEGKECGPDGCGGLCNNCLDIVYDDGSTETAYGYSQEPDHKPSKVVCVVRFDLPQEGMTLKSFTAGWMYGLYKLEVPFTLSYIPGGDMTCEEGGVGLWFTEWCETQPAKLVPIGDFKPAEPYTPMGSDVLGQVVFPTKTIYLAAAFTIDQYPFFVCPLDNSGDGTNAFMMSQYMKTQGETIEGPSFNEVEKNEGVIPFRIRVSAP